MTTKTRFFAATGNFVSLAYTSFPKPAAAYKDVPLQKITAGRYRAGINFANIQKEKDKLEAGERGEFQSLPYGTWKNYPYLIEHKGQEYIRLYTIPEVKNKTIYLINGVQATKKQFASFLTPSQADKLFNNEPLTCFNVKAENVFFEDDAENEHAKECLQEMELANA